MLIVQHIKTEWTKLSRGMPGAVRRNAVPRELLLPVGLLAGEFLLHSVSADEHDRFQLRQQVEWGERACRYGSYRFSRAESGLAISFKYDYWYQGKPYRFALNRPLFTLHPGQRASLAINGRFASSCGQFYRQSWVNFAYVEQLDASVFLRREPDFFVDMRANLF